MHWMLTWPHCASCMQTARAEMSAASDELLPEISTCAGALLPPPQESSATAETIIINVAIFVMSASSSRGASIREPPPASERSVQQDATAVRRADGDVQEARALGRRRLAVAVGAP